MGYSGVLVRAVFRLGEMWFLPNPTTPARLLWWPVIDARASPNIIKFANEPHERVAAEGELSKI
jgi:hypothetical protein